jgi:hypothetical protein
MTDVFKTLSTATDDFTISAITEVWEKLVKNDPSNLPVMIPLMGYAVAYIEYVNASDSEFRRARTQLQEVHTTVYEALGGDAVFGASDESYRLTNEVIGVVNRLMAQKS